MWVFIVFILVINIILIVLQEAYITELEKEIKELKNN